MTWIVGVLSGLGLLLAGIGLAGAICSSVVERRKELGIRIALGAGSGQLQWMRGIENLLLLARR
jgi:putative ABC transport system permease protein